MPIKIQNVSPVKLGNLRPGSVLTLDTDDLGRPLDFFWRRRLEEDEHSRAKGEPVALLVITDPVPAPTPVAPVEPTPEPAPKGKKSSPVPASSPTDDKKA